MPTNKVISLIKGKIDNFLIIPQFPLSLPEHFKYFLINLNKNKIIFLVKFTQLNYSLFKIKKIQCFVSPIVINGTLSKIEKCYVITQFINYLSTNYNHQIISITQLPNPKPFLFTPEFKKWKLSFIYSLIVDLSLKKEKLFYNLEKRTRYTLRKFTKLGNKDLISDKLISNFQNNIKVSSDYKDLKYFYKDWIDIKKKIIQEGLIPPNTLEKSILDNTFVSLSKANYVKLFLIFDEYGKIGASAIIFTIKDTLIHPIAYYSAGSSSEIGRKLGLPTILQWFIINWLKCHKFQYYDLGGYNPDPNHGPSQFKKGFGGTPIKGWTLIKQSPLIQYLNSILNLIKIKKHQFLIKFKIN